MKILRIYGEYRLGGIAKSVIYTWNSKICNLYRVLNIVYDIKIRRLECVGHIIRKKDEWIPKKGFSGKVHNTRPVEKLRTR
jgi:hypothetical protein